MRDGLSRALSARGWRLAARNPAVVHIQVGGSVSHRALADVERRRARGARVVVTLQDLDHPDLPDDPAADARLAELIGRADALSAVSVPLARAARRRFGRRWAVVGNGVDEGGAGRKARRDGATILAASRLAPYKGIDLLLMAFAALAARRPRARLLILGRDFQGGHARRLARALGLSRRVRFAGELPAPRVRACMRRARLFVFPSRRETWGMALMEALACAAPCLTARVGAAAGLRSGRDALVFKPGDLGALTRGLSRLWDDAALRRRLSAAGPRVAARRSWTACAARCERLYRGRA